MDEEIGINSVLPATALERPADALTKRYLNARVLVYYHNSYTDTGIISFMDTLWIEITKDTTERLLIPMMAIRLLKIIEDPKRTEDAATLLRAAGPQDTITK